MNSIYICTQYMQAVPKKCIHVSNNCKLCLLKFIQFSKCNRIYKFHFIVLSPPVLKLTSTLVQALLTMQSNGITKQSPWYLRALTFNGCTQSSICCRFRSVDCLIGIPIRKSSGVRFGDRGEYSMKPLRLIDLFGTVSSRNYITMRW